MFDTKTSVAALSVASNSLLVGLKIGIALLTGSVSILSEALHSGIDLLAAMIALISVRLSGRPPDENHSYGHGKIENVSGTVEAILIVLAAGVIIYEAVKRLLEGPELASIDLGIAVMLFSALVNGLVSHQLMKVARRTESIALEADAWHLTTDVLTSVGVLIGLVTVRLTGLTVLDPIVAIGVALVILKAAIDLTRKSFLDLLDQSLPPEEQERITSVLENHLGGLLVGYHQVRSRKSGSERHVDMHIVVNRSATVEESHALCDHLEQHLQQELGNSSVSIHVEPCDDECRHCRGGCTGDTRQEAARNIDNIDR